MGRMRKKNYSVDITKREAHGHSKLPFGLNKGEGGVGGGAGPLECHLGVAGRHGGGDPSAHPGSAGTAHTEAAGLVDPESVSGTSPA